MGCTGMPYPYYYQHKNDGLSTLRMSGPPLGILAESSVETCSVQLQPGDMLFLLSDGFRERKGPAQEVWGDEAVEATLLAACREEPDGRGIIGRVFAACNGFAETRANDDDMTIVVIKIKMK